MNLSTNMRVELYKDTNAVAHSTDMLQIGDYQLDQDENQEISFKNDFYISEYSALRRFQEKRKLVIIWQRILSDYRMTF